ncbi:hypothetical protein VUR80DRAFT_3533 [Thermomyces stellatus]
MGCRKGRKKPTIPSDRGIEFGARRRGQFGYVIPHFSPRQTDEAPSSWGTRQGCLTGGKLRSYSQTDQAGIQTIPSSGHQRSGDIREMVGYGKPWSSHTGMVANVPG